VGPEIDVFSGSKHESDAREFETSGVTFKGGKPSSGGSGKEDRP